ncbi:MAG: hypothetical protein KA347_06585 [Bacteroidia bacterium]|nr:hypothetical protein [Bacteroidia bacterium]
MERGELIKSKEYWITSIALSLWKRDGEIDANFEHWEKVAEYVVNDFFIKAMDEVIKESVQKLEIELAEAKEALEICGNSNY